MIPQHFIRSPSLREKLNDRYAGLELATALAFIGSQADNLKFGEENQKTLEELKKEAASLKKLANDEIKKLEEEGKTSMTTELVKLEQDITTLEKHLDSLQSNTEPGKVAIHVAETVLRGLKSKLDAEIKKLESTL
ncbi:hypothetical protein RDWZM_000063 [Blomia tropicalis]|uniref:Uncharacterized protein n=1 Tax=Blomia tropicalis TaxID=40697 RepID=A0A9Q0MA49_BLOTA|nr:hypothetical protein RDWZM_000063 [Blomia tropicalis]